MQVNCPNCGEKIAAENINIHKMIAVCSACDTVFPFDSPESKTKRRKVKQPQHLALRDADNLHMSFRTNFRLGENEAFVGTFIGSAFLTFFTLLMTNEMLTDGMSPLLPLGFGLAALFMYYAVALIIFNKTHIEMDENKITVSRKPLPSFLAQDNVVNLFGVVKIVCEETKKSKKEDYDMPRYRVLAETADGSQKLIVNDVIEDYAYFIAQRLEERLHTDADFDVSHLEDIEADSEDKFYGEEAVNFQVNEG